MTEPNHDQPEGPGRTRRRSAVTAAAGALVLAAVAGVVATRDGDETRTAAPPDDTTGTSVDTTATTSTETTATTAAPAASAIDGLAPFLTAAADLDVRLHEAATAINGAGPPWTDVPTAVAEKVAAADVVPVGRTVPAGLPPDLWQGTILVYSDLVSRRAAMQSFTYAGPAGPSSERLMLDLAQGQAAAERFDGDFAALNSRAAAAPPFEPGRSDDRATAEVLLLVRYTDMANFGCDSRGGWVATEPPPIVWSEEDPPDWMEPGWQHHGTIGTIEFSANLRADGTWEVQIWAC